MNTDWTESFFSGWIVEAQRQIAAMSPTSPEADYLATELRLVAGSRVLDVPCGEGRLSRALADRGCNVTGVDSSSELLAAARLHSSTAQLIQRDMRNLDGLGPFDAAFCFGNSFSYFDDAGNLEFLRSVTSVIRPGGRFALETHFAAESLLPQPLGRRWYPMGDLLFLHESRFDASTSVLTSDYIVIRDGRPERKSAHYRVFLFRELHEWLTTAGLRVVSTHGSLKREPFGIGSPGLWVIAERD